MPHEQVLVKVNALVDRGVATLVVAMNELPGILTASSCEGDDEKDAFVTFLMVSDEHGEADFAGRLSIALGRDRQLADCGYSISAEWFAGGSAPLGYLKVPHRHIDRIAEAVRSAATTWSTRDEITTSDPVEFRNN